MENHSTERLKDEVHRALPSYQKLKPPDTLGYVPVEVLDVEIPKTAYFSEVDLIEMTDISGLPANGLWVIYPSVEEMKDTRNKRPEEIEYTLAIQTGIDESGKPRMIPINKYQSPDCEAKFEDLKRRSRFYTLPDKEAFREAIKQREQRIKTVIDSLRDLTVKQAYRLFDALGDRYETEIVDEAKNFFGGGDTGEEEQIPTAVKALQELSRRADEAISKSRMAPDKLFSLQEREQLIMNSKYLPLVGTILGLGISYTASMVGFPLFGNAGDPMIAPLRDAALGMGGGAAITEAICGLVYLGRKTAAKIGLMEIPDRRDELTEEWKDLKGYKSPDAIAQKHLVKAAVYHAKTQEKRLLEHFRQLSPGKEVLFTVWPKNLFWPVRPSVSNEILRQLTTETTQ